MLGTDWYCGSHLLEVKWSTMNAMHRLVIIITHLHSSHYSLQTHCAFLDGATCLDTAPSGKALSTIRCYATCMKINNAIFVPSRQQTDLYSRPRRYCQDSLGIHHSGTATTDTREEYTKPTLIHTSRLHTDTVRQQCTLVLGLTSLSNTNSQIETKSITSKAMQYRQDVMQTTVLRKWSYLISQ